MAYGVHIRVTGQGGCGSQRISARKPGYSVGQGGLCGAYVDPLVIRFDGDTGLADGETEGTAAGVVVAFSQGEGHGIVSSVSGCAAEDRTVSFGIGDYEIAAVWRGRGCAGVAVMRPAVVGAVLCSYACDSHRLLVDTVDIDSRIHIGKVLGGDRHGDGSDLALGAGCNFLDR